jgi:hypothetical protein
VLFIPCGLLPNSFVAGISAGSIVYGNVFYDTSGGGGDRRRFNGGIDFIECANHLDIV